MITPKTLKGFRDFLPVEARKRQYVITALKSVFELYGFEPLETPALEYEEMLTGKYGDEGEKLMYRFEDNGGRRVAMRYDQTVPLARVIGQYSNELPMPFKRYQIQSVWRAENTQKGRYREFQQCDIDTVGTDSPVADAEAIAVTAKSFEKLGLSDYKILINDRSVFGKLPISAVITIDKLKKMGEEKVREELKEKGLDPEELTRVMNTQMPENLKKIIEIAIEIGVDKEKIVFDPTIARGLNYYTGCIFETEIEGYSGGSVCSGGRYDTLIGMFSNRDIPAVGTSFGLDRIIDAMDEKNMFDELLSTVKVLVSVFSSDLEKKSIEISNAFREKNINTEVYLDKNAKMEKQLKYADHKNIPFVLIIGPQEIDKNVVTLKNLNTREQQEMTVQDAIETVKKG